MRDNPTAQYIIYICIVFLTGTAVFVSQDIHSIAQSLSILASPPGAH